MYDYQPFDWLRYAEPTDTVNIKVENQMDHSLLSPPSSPFIGQTATTVTPSTSLHRRRRSPTSSHLQRVRPYPTPRDITSRTDETDTMSGTSHSYSSSRATHNRGPERRSSDGDQPIYSQSSDLSSHSFSTPATVSIAFLPCMVYVLIYIVFIQDAVQPS
jgi:hypothetical protein